MEIVLHGRNVDLTESQRQDIERRVEHATRVFEQAVDKVDVEVFESANPRRSEERAIVELTASVSGRIVRIEAAATTLEAAVDDGIDRLTRQLRRLKERLIDRRRRVDDSPPAPPDTDPDEIYRVKQFVMKPMTIEEATLQMDMLGHSFYFFQNADTDRYGVLYRRRDGRLGLIEPS